MVGAVGRGVTEVRRRLAGDGARPGRVALLGGAVVTVDIAGVRVAFVVAGVLVAAVVVAGLLVAAVVVAGLLIAAVVAGILISAVLIRAGLVVGAGIVRSLEGPGVVRIGGLIADPGLTRVAAAPPPDSASAADARSTT